jgi:hypothetical protein
MGKHAAQCAGGLRGIACATVIAGALAGCNAFDAERLGAAPRGPDAPSGPGSAPGDDGDIVITPGAGAGADGAGGGSSGESAIDGGVDDAGARDAGTDAGSARDAGDPDAGDGTDAATTDSGDAGCASIAAEDVCTGIAALPTAPVIDGELDCGLELAAITPTAWNGTPALPAGHTTEVAVAHRPDGLYVYVEVRGQVPAPHPSTDPIYCGDAIELYLDADGVIDTAGAYDAPGTMQLIVAAPASDAAPNAHAERFLQGTTQGAWTSTAWRVRWLADGYALEAFVVAADLGLSTWSPDGSIGLDLVIDVAGPASSPDLRCGLQLGQYFLRVQPDATGCGGEPWCDARAFCVPALR